MLSRRFLMALVLVAIGFVAGCSRRVVDWDARLGELTDRTTGYYSYWTGMPRQSMDEVCVVVASRSEIEGRQVFSSSSVHEVYPTVSYDPERTYLIPEELQGLAIPCTTLEHSVVDTLVLGYFVKQVTHKPDRYVTDALGVARTKGLTWTRPTEVALGTLVEVAEQMRERAAAEGADAIVGLSVYRTDSVDAFGYPGLYMYGRAVVYGEILERPGRRVEAAPN